MVEYKTTNHRERELFAKPTRTVPKRFVFPSAEEFQQRVEERAETVNLSMEEVTRLVQEARSADR